jgi:hypothetical protein
MFPPIDCANRSFNLRASTLSSRVAIAMWLPPGGRAKERESYSSSPRGRNYCNQLNEQRVRIGWTRENTTKADRIISDLCQQDELLPNLRQVVLDRVNVG